jgi:hypothetical protein
MSGPLEDVIYEVLEKLGYNSKPKPMETTEEDIFAADKKEDDDFWDIFKTK